MQCDTDGVSTERLAFLQALRVAGCCNPTLKPQAMAGFKAVNGKESHRSATAYAEPVVTVTTVKCLPSRSVEARPGWPVRRRPRQPRLAAVRHLAKRTGGHLQFQ